MKIRPKTYFIGHNLGSIIVPTFFLTFLTSMKNNCEQEINLFSPPVTKKKIQQRIFGLGNTIAWSKAGLKKQEFPNISMYFYSIVSKDSYLHFLNIWFRRGFD